MLQIQNNRMKYDTIQYDIMRCDAIQYDTIRYNTIRYDTIFSEYKEYKMTHIIAMHFINLVTAYIV